MSYHNRNKSEYAPECPNHEGVVCWPSERHCDSCGWNPVVADQRLEEICDKLGIKLPCDLS